MGASQRCTLCGYKWGSVKTEGYCRTCYPKRYDDDGDKNVFADFCDDHVDKAFFPKSFGLIKNKFGLEDR